MLGNISKITRSRLSYLGTGAKYIPMLQTKRTTTFDYTKQNIGNREIVGYGWNGSPCYYDWIAYPMPAVRFREPTIEICQLRKKERCDWRKLTIEEKKCLYRYSFCETFEETRAPSPQWKHVFGVAIWACAIGTLMTYSYFLFLYGPLPDTFDYHRKQAQLKRIIAMEVNPVEGLTSHWDYERNRWKK